MKTRLKRFSIAIVHGSSEVSFKHRGFFIVQDVDNRRGCDVRWPLSWHGATVFNAYDWA